VVEELSRAERSYVPVHSKPGTGRRLGVAMIVVACALAAAFVARHYVNARHEHAVAQEALMAADAPAAVDVVRVEYAPPMHLLTLPGETRAWYESTIYARVNGYVNDWNKDIGDHVTPGAVLATIDTPELDKQLAAAQAKLNAAQSDVLVAKSNRDFAETTYKRWATADKATVSLQDQQEKEAEFKAADAKRAAASAQVKTAEAEVDRLKAMEKFKEVTAPFDGVITARRIDIGNLVTAGSTASTTSLYDIAQVDKIRVFVDVPQGTASEITDQMQAAAIDREHPDRVYAGKVARTSHAIDPAAKTLTVEVDIPNTDGSLLPGMYVEVSFKTSEAHPLLHIPASALSFRSGGPQVAVVSSDGRLKFHDVTIARDLGDSLEIASGLGPHERVALNISNQLADGDKVTAHEVEGPSASPAPIPNKTSTTVAVRPPAY